MTELTASFYGYLDEFLELEVDFDPDTISVTVVKRGDEVMLTIC